MSRAEYEPRQGAGAAGRLHGRFLLLRRQAAGGAMPGDHGAAQPAPAPASRPSAAVSVRHPASTAGRSSATSSGSAPPCGARDAAVRAATTRPGRGAAAARTGRSACAPATASISRSATRRRSRGFEDRRERLPGALPARRGRALRSPHRRVERHHGLAQGRALHRAAFRLRLSREFQPGLRPAAPRHRQLRRVDPDARREQWRRHRHLGAARSDCPRRGPLDDSVPVVAIAPGIPATPPVASGEGAEAPAGPRSRQSVRRRRQRPIRQLGSAYYYEPPVVIDGLKFARMKTSKHRGPTTVEAGMLPNLFKPSGGTNAE